MDWELPDRSVKPISILNDVLGPVMRGPSSSHTAGAYHLATLARELLDASLTEAEITFDRGASVTLVGPVQASPTGDHRPTGGPGSSLR